MDAINLHEKSAYAEIAYVGLGSNLDSPQVQIQTAIRALQEFPQSELMAISPIYRSAPMGPQDQPYYLNAVVKLATSLSARELLLQLQAQENAQGRVREKRWGPRSLDLDLLLHGENVMDDAELPLPHPGIYDRNFVLYPLYDIEPGLVFPDGNRLTQLMQSCASHNMQIVSK